MAFDDVKVAQAQIDLEVKKLFVALVDSLNAGDFNDIALTTATKAELDVLHGVTAGVVSASSAVVVGASKNLDTLAVALMSLGSAGIENTITAHSGGTQAAAFALSTTKTYHRITVVAAGNDSVKLPLATGSGNMHVVVNDAAANSAQLFGSGTDTIDGVATGTGVAVAAAKRRICIDYAAGVWTSILGA